ncbi:Uncharacterised protein [Mycobacteroides abscessus subsp. massiliense]|nr:Uncharacterised protein [Mycobacteroides abscessus subsp. massiliense]
MAAASRRITQRCAATAGTHREALHQTRSHIAQAERTQLRVGVDVFVPMGRECTRGQYVVGERDHGHTHCGHDERPQLTQVDMGHTGNREPRRDLVHEGKTGICRR